MKYNVLQYKHEASHCNHVFCYANKKAILKEGKWAMKFFIIVALLLPTISCSMEKRKAFEDLQEPRPKMPKITIFQAIERNDADTVRSLLKEKPNSWFTVDAKKRTPLHRAVKLNNKEIVKTLFAAGAMIDLKDAKGRTPLMVAVRNGNLEMVQFLLRARANPNLYDNEVETPLEMAFDKVTHALQQQDIYQQIYEKNTKESARETAVNYVKEANHFHRILRELILADANPLQVQKDKKNIIDRIITLERIAEKKGRKALAESYAAVEKSLTKL
jgi:ankyrin repeat protein